MNNDGHSGNEKADGLEARDDAALWNLLGRVDQPAPGPYFVRRVLREVSLYEETRAAAHWWQPAALWHACRRLPRLAFVAGAPVAAVLLLFAGLHLNVPTRPTLVSPVAEVPPAVARTAPAPDEPAPADPLADQEAPSVAQAEPVSAVPPAADVADSPLSEGVSAQDVEVIAELDTLLKHEQNRLWAEDTARF